MDKLFLLFTFFVLISPLQAQEDRPGDSPEDFGDCLPPFADEWIDINTFQTKFSTGSELSGRPFDFVITDHLLGAIFLSGLWLGGFDAGGNLKLAATEHDGQTDFYNGPLLEVSGTTDESICTVFDKIWIIHQADIEALQLDFADNGQLNSPVPEDIQTWPAAQNPDFEAAFGIPVPTAELAPFIDFNGDGIYNIADGDYPQIKGDVAYWKVINDAGGLHFTSNSFELRTEVHIMAYGYTTGEPVPALTRTLFYEITFINKDVELVDSLFIGLWSDPDLHGPFCGYDYIGTAVDQNMVYTYTALDTASACNLNDYQNLIVGMKLLQGPAEINNQGVLEHLGMSNSMAYNKPSTGNPIPATTDPDHAYEFYHLLNSHWKDGSPLTYGGNGYDGTMPSRYFLPDLPNTPSGWSPCKSGESGLDKRMLLSTGPITFEPGDRQTLTYAYTWATIDEFPCPDLSDFILETTEIQDFFDNNLSNADAGHLNPFQIELYPNPAATEFTLGLPASVLSRISIVRIMNQQGQELERLSFQPTLPVRHLPNGLYFVECLLENGQRSLSKLLIYR